MSAPGTLLRQLRIQGVRLAACGDRLHVEAPTGVVSAETRQQLQAAKTEVLAQLTAEDRVVRMSCSQFGRQHLAVEFRIPGLDETLWLVPQPDHVATLTSEGIRRGRIFTAHELAELLSIPDLTVDEFQKIMKLKTAFGAEIVELASDLVGSNESRRA